MNSLEKPLLLPITPAVTEAYLDPRVLGSLRIRFQRDQFVKLPHLLTAKSYELAATGLEHLHSLSVRKEFLMQSFASPRRMRVVGGRRISHSSPGLVALYGNKSIRSVVSSITGGPVYTTAHREEFMVANFLDNEADTHGWHTDDPEYALIVITEVPPPNGGGELEYVPSWNVFCLQNGFDPRTQVKEAVQAASARGAVRSCRLIAGDCYLIHASKAIHRVTPTVGRGRRAALNMSFDGRRLRQYGESADLLYGSGT